MFFHHENYEYVVEIINQVKKADIGLIPPYYINANPDDTRDFLDYLIISFRLLKEGFIDYEYIFSLYQLELLGGLSFLNRNLHIHGNERYNFNESELIDLVKILNYIQTIRNKNFKIDLVLDRFNFTYERKRITDKIIDLAVAYETLFTKKNDGKDSITFKLKLRIARLLGKDYQEKKNIAKKIDYFYTIRSKIVHGESNVNKTDSDILNETKEYLRKSIIIYLDKQFQTHFANFDHNSFIDELDYK